MSPLLFCDTSLLTTSHRYPMTSPPYSMIRYSKRRQTSPRRRSSSVSATWRRRQRLSYPLRATATVQGRVAVQSSTSTTIPLPGRWSRQYATSARLAPCIHLRRISLQCNKTQVPLTDSRSSDPRECRGKGRSVSLGRARFNPKSCISSWVSFFLTSGLQNLNQNLTATKSLHSLSCI
jgi:hypothetical protein